MKYTEIVSGLKLFIHDDLILVLKRAVRGMCVVRVVYMMLLSKQHNNYLLKLMAGLQQ